jgi:hypothetical protein
VSGPWEKYAQPEGEGPWAKYAPGPPKEGVGVAQQAIYGLNEKMLEPVGAVADVVERGVTGLFRNPFRGLEARTQEQAEPTITRQAYERFARPDIKPVGPGERIARRAGQEVGAAIPLAAVPLGAAQVLPRITAQTINQAATPSERAAQALVGGIQRTPALATTGELAAATGAGVGAGLAGEIAPGSQTAEVIGQVAGGFAPTVLASTPTALALRLGKNIWGRVSPEAQTAAARQSVADILGPELQTAQPGIEAGQRLQQDIPGFQPTLAEATGSPALVATQRQIEGQAQGRDLANLAGRRQASEQAVGRFARESAPEGTGSPEFVVDTARRQVADLRQGVQRDLERVGERSRQLGEAIPVADRPAAGAYLRDKLNDVRSQTSGQMSQLATRLGINDADVTAPFVNIRQTLVDDFKPKSIFEDMANDPDALRLLRDMEKVPENVTFADLKALRERISDDLIDAQGASNPNRRKIRTLTMMRERYDNLMNEALEAADPTLAQNYRQFRETYKRDYIDRFEQGAAFKVRQKDGRAFYRTNDEDIATSFFGPGDVTAIRQFRRVYGDDPQSWDALAAVALDDLRLAAVRDGELNRRSLDSWLRRHQSVINEMPAEYQQAFKNLDQTSQLINAREAQVMARDRQIGQSILARELDALERGTKTPQAIIDAAVKDPRKMLQLSNRLKGDEAAIAALRRNIWDSVADAPAKDLGRFLESNLSSLSRVMTPKHIADLRKIQQAREMLERVPSPTGRAYDPNPMQAAEDFMGMGIPQVGSRVFAAQSGRTSYRYIATDMLGRFLRGRSKAEANALMREALYDPKVAADLAQFSRMKSGGEPIARRLEVRLQNLGAIGEDEEQ